MYELLQIPLEILNNLIIPLSVGLFFVFSMTFGFVQIAVSFILTPIQKIFVDRDTKTLYSDVFGESIRDIKTKTDELMTSTEKIWRGTLELCLVMICYYLFYFIVNLPYFESKESFVIAFEIILFSGWGFICFLIVKLILETLSLDFIACYSKIKVNLEKISSHNISKIRPTGVSLETKELESVAKTFVDEFFSKNTGWIDVSPPNKRKNR